MSGLSSNVASCGLVEVVLFVLAVAFGTGCSICSKTMMGLTGTNGAVDEYTGEPVYESFQKPLFQTFGMFVGMTFGLVMHAVVVKLRLPFPGYEHGNAVVEGADLEARPTERTALTAAGKVEGGSGGGNGGGDDGGSSGEVPTWMYFFLAIPAIFDLAATALW